MVEDNLYYYNQLPQSVTINNKTYAINTDYRIFIDFEMGMVGNNPNEALNKALNQFYQNPTEIEQDNVIIQSIEKFFWFYKCGLEDYQEGRTISKAKKTTQIFNYYYDAQLICGSYLLQGYDLHKYMHWWKFKEIWNSLPDDCEFSKIKSYRAYDGEDKDRIELREYYKLPPTEAEIKDSIRRQQLYEALK